VRDRIPVPLLFEPVELPESEADADHDDNKRADCGEDAGARERQRATRWRHGRCVFE
jgi:hypothetical protein